MPPISRRERPSKAPLSREAIVRAALAILRSEGLDKVTMRRIAAALETGAASLYVYVNDTQDLYLQMLDALAAEVPAPKPSRRWRTDLQRVTEALLEVLMRYPEMARVSMSTHATGPSSLRVLDTIVGLLRAGGADLRAAAWGVDLVLAYVVAQALEHGARKDDLTDLRRTVAELDGKAYPHLAELGSELVSGEGVERFRWGLDVIVRGVIAQTR